jgi:signal peptidase I
MEKDQEDLENTQSNSEIKEKETEQKTEQKTKRTPLSVISELLIYAVIVFACVYFIPTYVMQRTIVDGPSMENTLHNKESLLVDKCVFRLSGLNRFDIIVFYPYGKEAKEYYVKRLIGMPGETVQIKGKNIYINGKVLKENYGKDPITFSGIAEEPITLGKDQYFVLGDNREVSLDSRYEEVGLVSRKNIGGRAMIRLWPLNKFGSID